jgi:integrase
MSAWVYQDDKQVKKRGADRASWYVGWFDPAGKKRCKSCGPGAKGRRNAERLRQKVDAELLTGQYEDRTRRTWAEFRKDYEARLADGVGGRRRRETLEALAHFERLAAPKRMAGVTSLAVAGYVAARRKEAGPRPDTTVSPATVNKELRHLRAVFRKAARWGYLAAAPEFEFLREAKKIPVYMPPEDFALAYAACDSAKLPDAQGYTAGDWWRALLVTAYMTGWRIGALLALRREDVDLDKGTALSRAEDNKGKRDQLIVLHPLAVEHLRALPGFSPVFFPWHHRRATLFDEFGRIQAAGEVKPPAGKARYTFHDLRRAFATMNADRLSADALQALMQHQDYKTTQRYINMARQLRPAAQSLFVPTLEPRAGMG